MIKAENISKYYGDLCVLQDVHLEIQEKSIVAIVGKSGAGKTTLLHLLGTLEEPTSGEIYYQEKPISALSNKEISSFRNKNIGFVFQFHHLLEEFTALENVCIPAMIGNKKLHEIKSRASELLSFLGLSERMEHKPSELSGGEQQRVAIARALINDPYVVFADEPTGNLDSKTSDEIHDLFFKLRNEMNQTFVIVTHNLQLADQCDRTIHLDDGHLAGSSN